MTMTFSSASVPCLFFILLILIGASSAAAPPRAVLLPVTKDAASSQYLTRFQQRTPSTPVRLAVDLGSRYSWIPCDKPYYVSSSIRPVHCNSSLCRPSRYFFCTANKTCGGFPDNPYTSRTTGGELFVDFVTVPTTDGVNARSPVTIPNVAFSCPYADDLVNGLANGVSGMAGFGRTQLSLSAQFSSGLGVPNKFALCLPSSGAGDGAIFFGTVPSYHFLPNTAVTSNTLFYTPLLTNPYSTAGAYSRAEPSFEYFIDVKGFKINDKVVPLNASLLSITSKGQGGSKLSTVNPYTVLETSIYKALVYAFTSESGLKPVPPVAPFGACYDATNVGSSRVGPNVPVVGLILRWKSSRWAFYGANSVVQVRPGVLCLAFVDGGKDPRTSVVIGGYQLENSLLQFDLSAKRLGISETLLYSQTSCSNFNHTGTGA